MKIRKTVRKVIFASLAFVVGLGFVACLEVRDNDNDTDGQGDGCEKCHAVEDLSSSHSTHLNAKTYGQSMECGDCHVVPADWFVTGHLDGKVGVSFNELDLAMANGSTSVWDGKSCNDNYCHGATLSGGTLISPAWDGSQTPNGMQCGMCHGYPPEDHPATGKCSSCHFSAYETGEDGVKRLNTAKHINGDVDYLVDGDESEDEGEEADTGTGE